MSFFQESLIASTSDINVSSELNLRLILELKMLVFYTNASKKWKNRLFPIINFALVKLLRLATEENVRERERETQSREGALEYIAAWLSPKSFYKIFVTLTRFRFRQPRNWTDFRKILHSDCNYGLVIVMMFQSQIC